MASRFDKSIKRSLDVAISSVGLLTLLPILLPIAGLVRLFMGSGVFFHQQRPGFHGQPFFLYKFRTMNNRRDAKGNLLPDTERLTAFGRFLRATSLDELPQLWNVLKGEMSLVGPRPLLMEYLPRYTVEQARRHDTKPGITGWAQVNGRNAISWEEKFQLDVWYVDHFSLGLDFKILGLTVLRVLKRSGISNAKHVTMPMFTGGDDRAQ